MGGLHHSGTPEGVSHSEDCAIRIAAFQHARVILPAHGDFHSLFSALQLQLCDVPSPGRRESWVPPSDSLPLDHHVFIVDPEGPKASVYATLMEAVKASRKLRKHQKLPAGAPLTIALRDGVYYLTETLRLEPEDSGLTIRNYPGETATISGGLPLADLAWERSQRRCGSQSPSCWEARVNMRHQDLAAGFLGLRLNGERQVRARFPNAGSGNGVFDGESGWITSPTRWLATGNHTMNGIAGWPPSKTSTSHVVTAKDWPDVEWPMELQGNGTDGRLRDRGCHLGHGCCETADSNPCNHSPSRRVRNFRNS